MSHSIAEVYAHMWNEQGVPGSAVMSIGLGEVNWRVCYNPAACNRFANVGDSIAFPDGTSFTVTDSYTPTVQKTIHEGREGWMWFGSYANIEGTDIIDFVRHIVNYDGTTTPITPCVTHYGSFVCDRRMP